MSFFTSEAYTRLGSKNRLVKLNQLIDWEKITPHLRGIHKNEVNPKGGPKAYSSLAMFKALLLGQWHSLSDPALEEALRVRLDFMVFTGLENPEEVPDETTLWTRFFFKLSISS
ncbi:MAG: transposase [Simkania negevensis]|nr:transposase [Simkania negevensis]